MDVVIGTVPERSADGTSVEIVERKGIGHPDTICDSPAEETSLALCRCYRERFGVILHHNVDKVLLRGGQARDVPEAAFAECYLVSHIGHAIDDPQIADIRVRPRRGAGAIPAGPIEEIVRRHLASLAGMADELSTRAIVTGGWPLRQDGVPA